MNNQALYERLKGVDLGSQSDDWFRGLGAGFDRGRQDALDFMHRMRQSDPVEIAKRQKAETDAFNKAQEAKVGDFMTRFRTATDTQEKLPDIYSRVESKYGLPTLLGTAQRTSEQLETMPETQKNATRGYNVNSNQLARIINQKTAELAPVAQRAIQQFQTGSQLANQQMGFEVAQQEKELKPYETEAQMLGDLVAAQYTGFNQDKQNELNTYLKLIENNTNLTISQLEAANELAMKKLEYDNVKKDFITLSEGQTLFDPNTLKPLYTANKTYKPSGGGSDPLGLG